VDVLVLAGEEDGADGRLDVKHRPAGAQVTTQASIWMHLELSKTKMSIHSFIGMVMDAKRPEEDVEYGGPGGEVSPGESKVTET
jgi:hypothetical protein